jgi:hypothetical protein
MSRSFRAGLRPGAIDCAAPLSSDALNLDEPGGAIVRSRERVWKHRWWEDFGTPRPAAHACPDSLE